VKNSLVSPADVHARGAGIAWNAVADRLWRVRRAGHILKFAVIAPAAGNSVQAPFGDILTKARSVPASSASLMRAATDNPDRSLPIPADLVLKAAP
jgi:hypothetical protein